MAKHGPVNPERSKVRILFVEGDLAPGEISNITQAFVSAVRPAPAIARAPHRLPASAVDGDGANDTDQEIQFELGSDLTVEEETPAPTVTKAPSRPRNYKKPAPVDMDMAAGGKAFTDFAKEKGPESHRDKYLVAATWLHDFAKITTITPNHIFTCYTAADWIFDIADPTATFRQLKKEGRGTIPSRGSFSINHLGIAEVAKMKAASA